MRPPLPPAPPPASPQVQALLEAAVRASGCPSSMRASRGTMLDSTQAAPNALRTGHGCRVEAMGGRGVWGGSARGRGELAGSPGVHYAANPKTRITPPSNRRNTPPQNARAGRPTHPPLTTPGLTMASGTRSGSRRRWPTQSNPNPIQHPLMCISLFACPCTEGCRPALAACPIPPHPSGGDPTTNVQSHPPQLQSHSAVYCTLPPVHRSRRVLMDSWAFPVARPPPLPPHPPNVS